MAFDLWKNHVLFFDLSSDCCCATHRVHKKERHLRMVGWGRIRSSLFCYQHIYKVDSSVLKGEREKRRRTNAALFGTQTTGVQPK